MIDQSTIDFAASPVSLPVGPQPRHEESSEQLASRFADAYRRRFGSLARLVTVKTHGVDACISIQGVEVALGFVRYLQHNWFHEDEVAESALRVRMNRSLQAERIPATDIWVGWKREFERKKTGSSSHQRCAIPRRDAHVTTFLDEFVRFVRFACGLEGAQEREISLKSRRGAEASDLGSVAAAEYPALAQCCDSIRVQTTGVGVPSIRSSFDAGGIGVDRDQLATSVRDRMSQVIRQRTRLGLRPLWLVVHSDTWPLSRHLRELDRDGAFDLVRHQCRASAERFDAVWWLEGAASANCTLHRLS